MEVLRVLGVYFIIILAIWGVIDYFAPPPELGVFKGVE